MNETRRTSNGEILGPAPVDDRSYDQRQIEPRRGTFTEAQLVERAIEYHKADWGEGEYGCPGATCPGVQRLVRFAKCFVDVRHDRP